MQNAKTSKHHMTAKKEGDKHMCSFVTRHPECSSLHAIRGASGEAGTSGVRELLFVWEIKYGVSPDMSAQEEYRL